MAALLTSEIEDGNKRDILVMHIDDARRGGVEVCPPNINLSDSDFVVEDGQILFGLRAIKGCGGNAAAEIVRNRTELGKYRDIFDFCERIDLRLVSKGVIEKHNGTITAQSILGEGTTFQIQLPVWKDSD
jgi:DNA polymerase-3 subunit alpha